MTPEVTPEVPADQAPIRGRPSFGARAVRMPAFVTGIGVTGVVVLLALLAPVIGRYGPAQQNLLAGAFGNELAMPSGSVRAGISRQRHPGACYPGPGAGGWTGFSARTAEYSWPVLRSSE